MLQILPHRLTFFTILRNRLSSQIITTVSSPLTSDPGLQNAATVKETQLSNLKCREPMFEQHLFQLRAQTMPAWTAFQQHRVLRQYLMLMTINTCQLDPSFQRHRRLLYSGTNETLLLIMLLMVKSSPRLMLMDRCL